MVFITLNNSARIKVGAIISYQPQQSLEGTAEVFFINITEATGTSLNFVSVQYATRAMRDADLSRLDAAVNAFIEPLPSVYLSGNLNVHNTPLPFYPQYPVVSNAV